MTQAKRWSFSAGTRGVNRVRAYEEASGLILLEYWERSEDGGTLERRRLSLGHHDRGRARSQVKAIAARIAVSPAEEAGGITLGSLFDIYLAEVTPRKGRQKQAHDHRAARMFLALFGRHRLALSLNLRDWELFIDRRASGELSGKGAHRPVGARQVAYDLSWLRAVFHWATKAGADGVPLLERNPFEGYPMPRERNPARPVLTEEQYQQLLSVIGSVNWRAELALVLANETGHRISAIRQLRWSDVDLKTGRIHWRAAHDKSGFDHVTPMSQELAEALVQARRQAATIGDGWVIPAVRDPGKPCSRGTLDKWLQEAARRVTIPIPPRAGWHSLRRKFATELKDLPLKDLCYLGGWKDPKTLLECYQQPDEVVMREALLKRRPFRHTTVGSGRLNRQSRRMPGLTDLRKFS